MCSPGDAVVRGIVVAGFVTVVLAFQTASVRTQSDPANEARFERAEIARALDVVRADPRLSPERTIKTLRWTGTRERRQTTLPAWLGWTVGLFVWLDQFGRVLIWCTAAILAAMLVVYLAGLARRFDAAPRKHQFVAPTHVGDLDIRPEALPTDIGATARTLWERGEQRAALALLYRGVLSRLAHGHGVPIRDSSTEGECLSLAAAHLTGPARDYSSDVIRVWLRAVYGGEDIPTATIHVLCAGFAVALDSVAAADTMVLRGPA